MMQPIRQGQLHIYQIQPFGNVVYNNDMHTNRIVQTSGQQQPVPIIHAQVGQNVELLQQLEAASLQELEECKGLEVGWDSYGGDAPSALAISQAQLVLHAVYETLGRYLQRPLEPQYIEPRADGGIQIEWGSHSLRADIVIANDGHFSYLLVDKREGVRKSLEEHHVRLDDVIRTIAKVVFSIG